MPVNNDENITLTRCPFCAEKINALAKKCRYCGEIIDPALRLVTDLKPDNNSGVKVNIVTNSEPQAAVNNIALTATQPKERIAYVLLGIFLGWLGIHNFYAGYSGKGVTQLLITLLLGWLIFPLLIITIWNIVEVCIVNKDANGVTFC